MERPLVLVVDPLQMRLERFSTLLRQRYEVVGKVGDAVDLPTARHAARLTGLQILAAARAELGTLDHISRVVKVFGMVNCAPGFNRTPAVIDGCSELFHYVLGDAGIHTRSAVGLQLGGVGGDGRGSRVVVGADGVGEVGGWLGTPAAPPPPPPG